jgi:hypothetical protein
MKPVPLLMAGAEELGTGILQVIDELFEPPCAIVFTFMPHACPLWITYVHPNARYSDGGQL